MKVIWTKEQIAGIAPSSHLLKTGRSFAQPEKWLSLGRYEDVIWGVFPLLTGKPPKPIHTSILLNDLKFSCSCASRSFPCAHGLGLLQLMIDQPDLFAVLDVPEWVVQWQEKVQNQIETQRQRDTAVPPPPHHQQKKLAAIQSGASELELWLHDLVRNGLASARHKPKEYWFRMADRMVDAKAAGVAVELRQLAAIPADSANWAETILRRIGRLYLLVQGFQQFDQLSPEVQADLLTAVTRQTNTALSPEPEIHDLWHILGQETEQSGKRLVQTIWLWGQQSNRAAQISFTAHGQRHQDFTLMTGTAVAARLKFYISATPLHAQILERTAYSTPQNPVTGYTSIQAAAQDFNQALAKNPWLTRFPVMVTAVPRHNGPNWQLQDPSGSNLLLPTHYKQNWHLLALSGGRPLPIFGLFDGHVLTPLSVWSDGRYLPLHILRGVV